MHVTSKKDEKARMKMLKENYRRYYEQIFNIQKVYVINYDDDSDSESSESFDLEGLQDAHLPLGQRVENLKVRLNEQAQKSILKAELKAIKKLAEKRAKLDMKMEDYVDKFSKNLLQPSDKKKDKKDKKKDKKK